MDRKSLFNNIVVMAAADGKITNEEALLLADRAVKWGLGKGDIKDAIDNALAKKINLEIPDDYPSRVELLQEMFRMMAVDGEIAALENALLAAIAMKMDIAPAEFKSILQRIERRDHVTKRRRSPASPTRPGFSVARLLPARSVRR